MSTAPSPRDPWDRARVITTLTRHIATDWEQSQAAHVTTPTRYGPADPPGRWVDDRRPLGELAGELAALGGTIRQPPVEFAPVAAELGRLTDLVQGIMDEMGHPDLRLRTMLEVQRHHLSYCRNLNDAAFKLDVLLRAEGQAAGPPAAAETLPREVAQGEAGTTTQTGRNRRSKKSTTRGEGRTKLIAALTKHHQYAEGGSLNTEPIGNNQLARAAGVVRATASAFFKNKFGGWDQYRAMCQDAAILVATLKLLNGDFTPQILLGRRPPVEDDRGDQ